ncbi:OprO/OprP family phosphate-selective porin [Joostella sp. CR20]|uniref:OprO/OprP family phosphate-selective porin n=1 Tax=Joostella sp. CR20 TaxID=2804312 RepID=UPI00313B450E
MKNTYWKYVIIGIVFIFSSEIKAQEIQKDSLRKWEIDYGKKGFEFKSTDDRYLLQIQSRLQFRFATPDDQDPITFDDYDDENSNLFKINRARLKVGGNAYQTWLKYYWEYELSRSNLLDFRIMIEKWEWLNFKVGQWKIEYSRERRISSGEQQAMDRSILNRPFTVDRQQGVELYGRVKAEKEFLDFSYWAAVLTGVGRGATENDDKHLMYFGRFQWNFLGEDLGFEGSDIEIHEKPAAIIAIAGVTNRSPYTRFSQTGGGSLVGFEEEEIGEYRVNQYNIETAFVYKGFSWQSEWHHKNIINKLENDAETKLEGFYLQAGYLGHSSINWWPKPLEVAGRYSRYQPNTALSDNYQYEKTLALNWFFTEHKNKLTFEISHFDYETQTGDVDNKIRFRIQWDISL